ncbi:MAG: PASTA domain-containing protein, partial [Flavobacteriales bacterium]
LTIEEASIELEQLGLEYQVSDSVFTDSVPKGAIFTQNPIPGTFVKEGRLIYFTVNHNSSQKFEIPDVYNKSEREAINQLKLHFKLAFVKSENYSPVSSVIT